MQSLLDSLLFSVLSILNMWVKIFFGFLNRLLRFFEDIPHNIYKKGIKDILVEFDDDLLGSSSGYSGC